MKKKLIALLLVLVMVLSLFAACGSKTAEEPEEKEAPELAKGWYAVLNEDEETVAYLQSTGKKLTVYDEEGNEAMEASKFSWDVDEEAFVIGDAVAFMLEVSKKQTTFTVPKKSPLPIDKGTYTLDEIDEEDVPQPADTPDPVVDPEPTTDPEPAAAETFYTLPAACYRAQLSDKDIGYFKFDGTTLYMYDMDGVLSDSYAMSYDAETGIYTMDDGEQLKVNMGAYGDYYLTEPDTPGLEIWLYWVDESVIPTPAAAGTTTSAETFEFINCNGEALYVTAPAGLTPLQYINDTYVEQGWSEDTLNQYFTHSNDGTPYINSWVYAKNENGMYCLDVYVEDSWGYTSDDVYNMVNDWYQEDADNLNEDQIVYWTYPDSVEISGITFQFVYFDTLIDGEYSSDLLMVADNGVNIYFIFVNHWGITSEDSYNTWADFDQNLVGSFEIR